MLLATALNVGAISPTRAELPNRVIGWPLSVTSPVRWVTGETAQPPTNRSKSVKDERIDILVNVIRSLLKLFLTATPLL
jgi:hypothetical protein